MKSDVNGTSTCISGQEQYEYFTVKINGKRAKRIQYDYRTPNGQLFSCVAKTLVEARQKRDKWLIA